jgi:Flp pilus assembly protein TadD
MADVDEWHPEHTEMASSIAHEIRETLEQEAKARPDDPMAHYYLAYAKNFEGDYNGARKEVEKAIKLDESVAEFYKAQGLFQSHRGKHKDARKALERCIEIDPDYWPCHAWLGFTRIHLEDFEAAVQALERAVQLAPDAINARLQLGVAYAQVERFEDSARQFQAAIDLGNTHPMTRFNLAIAYYMTDRYPLAWVHATIAENMGWKQAEGMPADIERRMNGEPDCYSIEGNLVCTRP